MNLLEYLIYIELEVYLKFTGKLRIRFDRCWGSKRTVRIDLWFAAQVTGFSFDIADLPTVDGSGKRWDLI